MSLANVTLRDGSSVEVRPIRPDDKELVRAGFERLSSESRYRRFLTPMPTLTAQLLSYLTEVDHHDHEALIALDDRGRGLGIARFVREQGTDKAETAVTVVDDCQGRGLGTALLTMLADRARAEGIRRFTALVLAKNTEMLDLLEQLSPVRIVDRDLGTIEVEARLPDRELGSQLRRLLRSSAAGEVEPHPASALAGMS